MKNISIYKFLLPLSVIMLAIGAIIFFLDFFLGSKLGSNVVLIYGGLLLFGFVFFIVSLIDLHICRKRSIIAGQVAFPNQRSLSILKNIGIAIIAIILGLYAFMLFSLDLFFFS